MVQSKSEWDALSHDDKLWNIYVSFGVINTARDDVVIHLRQIDDKLASIVQLLQRSLKENSPED